MLKVTSDTESGLNLENDIGLVFSICLDLFVKVTLDFLST